MSRLGKPRSLPAGMHSTLSFRLGVWRDVRLQWREACVFSWRCDARKQWRRLFVRLKKGNTTVFLGPSPSRSKLLISAQFAALQTGYRGLVFGKALTGPSALSRFVCG